MIHVIVHKLSGWDEGMAQSLPLPFSVQLVNIRRLAIPGTERCLRAVLAEFKESFLSCSW